MEIKFLVFYLWGKFENKILFYYSYLNFIMYKLNILEESLLNYIKNVDKIIYKVLKKINYFEIIYSSFNWVLKLKLKIN